MDFRKNQNINRKQKIKTLGVFRNHKVLICFAFQGSKIEKKLFELSKTDFISYHTKRDVPATIARLFDPLGFLGSTITEIKNNASEALGN